MKNNLQAILSLNFNISNKIITYILSLLKTVTRKNCSSMAKENNIPVKELYDVFDETETSISSMQQSLIDQGKKLILKDPTKVSIVVDFTQLQKVYSEKIEDVCYDRNGCTNRVEKGISLGVLALVGENETIPLMASYWVQKKLAMGEYKSKTDIAKDLIREAIEIFGLLPIRLDGAFSSEDFLKLLKELNVKFVIRFPSNRRVKIKDDNGQIKKIFRLTRNERAKKIEGSYKSIDNLYFVAEKRRCKKTGEWETVYLVTNIGEEFSTKECIAFYSQGGAIEKFFRTSKQSLGIDECQMLTKEKQMSHIFATFLAYTFSSQQKIIKQKKSPEDIINMIRNGTFAES